MKRRKFLNNLPLLSAIPLLDHQSRSRSTRPFFEALEYLGDKDPKDEAYWAEIRANFNLSPEFIDFNTAGLSQLTKAVHDEYIDQIQTLYHLPSRIQNAQRLDNEPIISGLAEMTNCKPTELVLQRNATEALTAVIFGIPLSEGDEVIVGHYDYPHMYYAWKQRAERDGVVLKYVDIGKRPKSPKKIVREYVKKVSPRTKAIFITDLINYSGCQVPTKEIIAQLPSHVRYRIVDAAQSFANSRNNFRDFGATHVGTSLHKWLGAPAAAGLLYIKEDFIGETWPLFASVKHDEVSIKKFARIGTINIAIYSAILIAIQFNQMIGFKRKYNRLIDLSDYFVKKASKIKGLKIISSRHQNLKSNIIVFELNEMDPPTIKMRLWKNYKIHVTTFNWRAISGVRLSPNIFTSKSEIDILVNALSQMA